MSSLEFGENRAPPTVSVAVKPLCLVLVATFRSLMQHPEVGVEGRLTRLAGGGGQSPLYCPILHSELPNSRNVKKKKKKEGLWGWIRPQSSQWAPQYN